MRRLALLSSLALLTGCIAYNPDCAIDTSNTIGFTDVRLALSRTLLRTREMPVGNLVADAVYEAIRQDPKDKPNGGVDIALINAGAIRDTTRCEAIDAIGPGAITESQLSVMLPFNYSLAMREVRGAELLRALEHSVSHLGEAGDWGLAGQFLQVSHLRFSVDCSGNPAVGGQIIGTRIVDGSVQIITDTGDVPLDESEFYQVATNAFIAKGGDGYTWLTREVPKPLDNPHFEVRAVQQYIEAVATTSGPIAPQAEGRITIDDNCSLSSAGAGG